MFEEHFGYEAPLDYDEFVEQMYEQGLQDTPSVLQGVICGVLVVDIEVDPDYCMRALSAALEIEVQGALAELVLRLAKASRASLENEEYDFRLFLPDDEEAMEFRLNALSDWCRGFMASYALAVPGPAGKALNEDIAEVLRDVAAIAEVAPGPDPQEDEEEAERHYFDLTEYLRLACLNLFADAQNGLTNDD